MVVDAVSGLLRRGEVPVFLTADDLEWDKGIPDDEDMQLAKDLAAKRQRRLERIMKAKEDKRAAQFTEEVGSQVRTIAGASVVEARERLPTRAQKRRARRAVEQELLREATTTAPRWDPVSGSIVVSQKEVDRGRAMRRSMRAAHKRGFERSNPGRVSTSDRVLRKRIPKVDPRRAVPHRDDWGQMYLDEDLQDLVRKKKCGCGRVMVGASTIPKAGRGLFATRDIGEGGIVCDYTGVIVEGAEVARNDYDGEYVFEAETKGGKVYIDARNPTSCWGRFINDPLDDTLVNAKVRVKGSRLFVVATTDIKPGDEVFISYGPEYWMDRLERLDPKTRVAAEVEYSRWMRKEARGMSQGIETVKPRPMKTVREEPGESATTAAKRVRTAQEQLTDKELERYAYDNTIQNEEHATILNEMLVNRRFIDDENGLLYEVARVWYDEGVRAIVGERRQLSGQASEFDDDCFYVYGYGGLLMLTDLYQIGGGADDEVRWPTTNAEWGQAQLEDDSLKEILEDEDIRAGQEKRWTSGDVYRWVEAPDEQGGAVHRKFETDGRVIWQKVVPLKLREKCLQIFHEGMSHTGSTRMVKTMRLHYYWDGMRQEAINHCQECRGCKLRQIYYSQPKVPIQEYPEVQAPMERLHMDITGILPTTRDGNKYILVVKDFQTKYVWIFAIPDKNAETIATILVKEVFKPFGPPRILVSDRGTEFRNKVVAEICKQYRVKRVCTTRFNPRSNGFVENHNGTMKNQLYHYANAKHDDWDVYMHAIMQVYNTSVSVATGYTPFYAMFGREMQTSDMMGVEESGFTSEAVEGDAEGRTWPEILCERLDIAWTKITDRAHENYRRKNQVGKGVQGYNERSGHNRRNLRQHHYKEYAIGDVFYRKRNPLREFKSTSDKEKYKIARKLQARYEGPYRVTGRVSAVLYEAEVRGKTVIVHAINMKPDRKPSGPVQVSERGEMRYPPKRDRLYTVGPEPKGRLAGREHIADVAVGVWEEDEGVD